MLLPPLNCLNMKTLIPPSSFSAFCPVYSPDMPSRLPVQDIFAGLLTSVATAIRYWFHYTLVAYAWLSVVPLTACKSSDMLK